MLFSKQRNFCFLSNPKTATTSILKAFSRKKDVIEFHNNTFRHTTYRQFVSLCEIYGMNAESFTTYCIARHPFDRAKSWYKFRRRAELSGSGKSTENIEFATFVRNGIKRYRNTGVSQFTNLPFVSDDNGKVGVTKVYPFERLGDAVRDLEAILGPANGLDHENASPDATTDIPTDLHKEFEDAFAEEIRWYESL